MQGLHYQSTFAGRMQHMLCCKLQPTACSICTGADLLDLFNWIHTPTEVNHYSTQCLH